jgi:hypothetical protein
VLTITIGQVFLLPMRNPLPKDIAIMVVTNKYLFKTLSLDVQIKGTVVWS